MSEALQYVEKQFSHEIAKQIQASGERDSLPQRTMTTLLPDTLAIEFDQSQDEYDMNVASTVRTLLVNYCGNHDTNGRLYHTPDMVVHGNTIYSITRMPGSVIVQIEQ